MATERRYWDSCCFIAVLAKEAGRVDVCEAVLRSAVVRDVEIVTSAFTITEVLHPVGGKPLSPEVRATVKAFFRRSGIVIVDVNRARAEEAQEHFWDFDIRPKDAIHLASAIFAKVDVMETYDGKLLKASGKIGGAPPLLIREPQLFTRPTPTAHSNDLFSLGGQTKQ